MIRVCEWGRERAVSGLRVRAEAHIRLLGLAAEIEGAVPLQKLQDAEIPCG